MLLDSKLTATCGKGPSSACYDIAEFSLYTRAGCLKSSKYKDAVCQSNPRGDIARLCCRIDSGYCHAAGIDSLMAGGTQAVELGTQAVELGLATYGLGGLLDATGRKVGEFRAEGGLSSLASRLSMSRVGGRDTLADSQPGGVAEELAKDRQAERSAPGGERPITEGRADTMSREHERVTVHGGV
jgi:hypothetical protein